jgi:hypothetical protein
MTAVVVVTETPRAPHMTSRKIRLFPLLVREVACVAKVVTKLAVFE